MERVVKKLPLYLLLGGPAAYACVTTMGPELGVLVALAANFALWHILLRPEGGEEPA